MMTANPITRRCLLGAGTAALGTALAACSNLPLNRPAPQLYTLTPKSTFPDDLPAVGWQLAIDRPTSPAGLATTRIAVARGPHLVDYFAGAQWIDDAQSISLRSDFVLGLELREFQAEYTEGVEAPIVNVRLNVKLIELPQRRIVASATFDRLVPSPDNRMASIIEAFDQALGRVLRDVVVWTLTRPETVA
jgi:cholesterol transport system auxiliary component